MTTDPVSIGADEPILSLVNLFKSSHYHGLPVLDQDSNLVGIVRDTEILSMFASKEPFISEYRIVRDIMHTPPLVIGPNETIQRAVTKMFADGTRFLVVVAKDQGILGVVTRIDLIKGVNWRRD